MSPQAEILITQPGLSNYRMRQLWGYDIIHRRLAAKIHNAGTIQVTDRLGEFQKGNISGTSFIDIEANGNNEYKLPWQGHWQGFEVWIDNKNIYGKDCYIESGRGYVVDQNKKVSDLNMSQVYYRSNNITRPMRLVFTKNVPEKGTIRVIKADTVWSGDYCHNNDDGIHIYGQIYIDRIKDVLH